MKLLFERSVPGRRSTLLPQSDVPSYALPDSATRKALSALPELSELDLVRHYTELCGETFGVNNGFYPLGSCTMKYNPAVNEAIAAMPGFARIHPLQPVETVQGALSVMCEADRHLSAITGMDGMTFQPAAGAHGELTGMLMIKAYHEARGDKARNKVIVPDAAHGTNPATASMVGYEVISVPSTEAGSVDLAALRAVVGNDTAGLMLTNPNTLGLFDPNILEITKIIHEAGGLNYYDGANLNAIMGVARPGDMGFDVVHLNLHKTFATPHGGGGPGLGAVGAKEVLLPYLPTDRQQETGEGYALESIPRSIGRVKAFYGHFGIVLRTLAYISTLGGKGIRHAAQTAVLNANYMKRRLEPHCKVATEGLCMHEFILSLEEVKRETGVTAMDLAKAMLDYGMHAPTMYFPLIVPEALMIEPTETESKGTLDEAVDVITSLLAMAKTDPEHLKDAPHLTYIARPDEVTAARKPVLRYEG